MGPDRRERTSSFLEPLELEDLDSVSAEGSAAAAEDDGAAAEDADPNVFDRITAVPSEVPAALIAATKAQDSDPISGLHERTEPGLGGPNPGAPPLEFVAAPSAPPSDLPPVLAAKAETRPPRRRTTKPFRSPSRPSLERAARRTPAPQKMELELVDVTADAPPSPTSGATPRDALEVDLPTRGLGGLVPSIPMPPEHPALVDMKDRYATGDFSGALVIAEGILGEDPEHEDALRCRDRCTETLSQMYLARLGSLRQIIRVAVSQDQIRWLSLDHRAGFLLSLIDGTSSIDELLDVSSMPRLEALRILYGLLDQRVIELSD